MRDLNVTGVDDGAIVASDADGETYRIAIDELTLSRLRRPAGAAPAVRVSPREIQTHLRAGLSRDDVAALTGASLDEVARFEGPVLAELEYIINSALSVPASSEDAGDNRSVTVGARVRTQIDNISGTNERWASWRNAEGDWQIKCTFEAAGRDHEARWTFDPRHHLLTPLNDEAANLLADQAFTSGLIPRLRAVDHKRRTTGTQKPVSEASAENSSENAADVEAEAVVEARVDVISATVAETVEIVAETVEIVAEARHSEAADATPEHSLGTDTVDAPTPTADLMAALRKRRGENHDAPTWLAEAASGEPRSTTSGSITDELAEMQSNPPTKPQRTGGSRRSRAQMPTWDEIVFGTKVDDDPI